MTWRWQTTPDGFVEVDRGTGFERIALPSKDATTERTETWLALAKKNAAKAEVPLSWILGVIYSESGGEPDVRNFCCAGLMALALKVYKITEAEAFDPEINVALGAKTLGDFKKKGFDLPSTASMYNAGPSRFTGGPKTDAADPWGFAENRPAVPWTGYIEKVVRASNWWRQRELAGDLGVAPKPPEPLPVDTPAEGAKLVAFLAAGAAGFYGFNWARRHRWI